MSQTNSWTPVTGLYHWEKTRPDEVFLTQPRGSEVIDYTWAQAGDQVRRMAAHLESRGFPPGSRIAIMSKNCAHWIMAELAILMAGHVSVPIYPSVNAETLRFILEHSETSLLILGEMEDWKETGAGVPDRLPIITIPGAPEFSPPRENALPWDDLVAVTQPMQGEVPPRKADDLAIIIYTSGSTGQPKGVMIGFGAMAFAVGNRPPSLRQVSPGGSHAVLSAAGPRLRARGHVGQLALRYGLHVYFNESLATFAADLKRARPTVFLSVPRLWVKFQLGILQQLPQEKIDALLANPATADATRRKILTQLGLQEVRFAITGSAPLPAAVLEWYRELGLELLEGYGMTENFGYSHISFPGRTRVGYVGHPLDGVERRISEAGEILVKSPACMLGYYKQPELTAGSVHRRRFLQNRRHGRGRRGWPSQDHRPRQGAVQDQQGQVRRAGADREHAREPPRRRSCPGHGQWTAVPRSGWSCSAPTPSAPWSEKPATSSCVALRSSRSASTRSFSRMSGLSSWPSRRSNGPSPMASSRRQ